MYVSVANKSCLTWSCPLCVGDVITVSQDGNDFKETDLCGNNVAYIWQIVSSAADVF